MKTPVVLIIMDGYGLNPKPEFNAVATAKTPVLNRLMQEYPTGSISASGLAVGLPEGQMGNSEVGHTNMGAGRIVYQALTRITKDIADGGFYQNAAFLKAIQVAKNNNGTLHVMGLCSDGGVHSHLDHLYALIKLCKMEGLERVAVHCFMDGRDVPPTSGKDFIIQLEATLQDIGVGKIASVSGRYYAMDRDHRWERVSQAYAAMVGQGKAVDSAVMAMESCYAEGVTDEFIVPSTVMVDGQPVAVVQPGDAMVFVNFRPDRAREITRAFIEPDFADFDRPGGYRPVTFVSMSQYDETFENLDIAYDPEALEAVLRNTFGEWLAKAGKTQLRIAETEKYAHVTFFFNGGEEALNEGEERVLIPSPKVATYDLQPEMSAPEVARECAARIRTGEYDAVILNFANCDMVGHTGVMDAAVKAVETVDACVGMVVDAVLEMGGKAIITADHGNAEQMVDYETGQPYTAHSVSNPVPVVLVDPRRLKMSLRPDGCLADIIPTMLQIMNMQQPKEMTGKTLITK